MQHQFCTNLVNYFLYSVCISHNIRYISGIIHVESAVAPSFHRHFRLHIYCIYCILFNHIGKLTDGLLLVKRDGLMGAINARGEVVIPVEWTYVQEPVLDLLVVRKDGMSGVLDMSGAVVLPPLSCRGMHVNEADSTIRIRQGTLDGDERYARSGVFDLTGREIVPCIWGDVGDFSEGLAAVRDGDMWGYVNLQGELVIPCVWSAAWEFYDGYAVVRDECLYGVIDTTGAEVEPCVWERLEYQGDGWFEGRQTVVFELTE